MSGLLAWAADVVGGGGQSNDEEDLKAIPIVFTPEQQQYAIQLDQKSSSLKRSIQDLRSRLPPPDISQRLPHLHAHSVASNAALSLQLNAHSSTKQQVQLREVTLQEENAAYEKAISECEKKVQEKVQESGLLHTKLQEMDLSEKSLKDELEKSLVALNARQSVETRDSALDNAEDSKSKLLEELENKKKELRAMEEMVQNLEKKWALVQENALKHPSPVQREKLLDRQLHSLMEQLASKQAQAEGLVSEIHLKEMELERLNGLWRRLESNTTEVNIAINRFGGSNSERESLSSGYIVDPHHRPYNHLGGRTDTQQRLMLLRSAFVVYILALHILVFIRISF